MDGPVRTFVIIAIIVGALGYSFTSNRSDEQALLASVAPNWDAISAWPRVEISEQIAPDPDRVTTVIVLDDSGSMANDMRDARDAVVRAVQALPDNARVAVIGLNNPNILEAMPAPDARSIIRDRVARIPADGSTPLAAALSRAHAILESEAAMQRGFGTYRIILTTDGEADSENDLRRAVAQVLSTSPVELTTIGIGLGRGHVLQLEGHTTYLRIRNISQLEQALLDVNAEQTAFEQLDSFE
ncbi:MAG: vWA domain-containing protein [Pseudomonadota bacterium]